MIRFEVRCLGQTVAGETEAGDGFLGAEAAVLLRQRGVLPRPGQEGLIHLRRDTDAAPRYTSEQWARGERTYLVASRSGMFTPVEIEVRVLRSS